MLALEFGRVKLALEPERRRRENGKVSAELDHRRCADPKARSRECAVMLATNTPALDVQAEDPKTGTAVEGIRMPKVRRSGEHSKQAR